MLRRDPGNPHDENAIEVVTLSGEQVGHIPADRAEMLAEGIGNGRQFYALVDKVEISRENKEKNHYVISIHEIAKADQTVNITQP